MICQTNFKSAFQTYCEYEGQFKKSFGSLVYEKNLNENILKTKTDNACKRAFSIFAIEGEKEFADISLNRLKKICELKPGRSLMKALSKTPFVLSGRKIKIIHGTDFGMNGKCDIVCSNKATYIYKGLDQHIHQAPSFVALAHELIHFLHQHREDNECMSLLEKQKSQIYDCLPDIDNLEEQHTTCGFSHLFFEKIKNLTKLDVLCENVFLLALGLFPRINHRGYAENEIDSGKYTISNSMITQYSEWIKLQLESLYTIPLGKERDVVFMASFAKKSLYNLKNMSLEIRTSDEFIYFFLRAHNDDLSYAVRIIMEFVDLTLIVEQIIEIHKEDRELRSKTLQIVLWGMGPQKVYEEKIVSLLLTYINCYSTYYHNLFSKINGLKGPLSDAELSDIKVIKMFINQVETRFKGFGGFMKIILSIKNSFKFE